MKLKSTLLQSAVVLIAAAATLTVSYAGVIPHDQVKPFAQRGAAWELKFKPYLDVVNGCVPFPAVDAAGNTSGGLKPTGASSSNCAHSVGQVYARGGWYHSHFGIVYSWYFPKDEPSQGIGHRHDWEEIVVWIDNPKVANPRIFGVAHSQHGGYGKESYAALVQYGFLAGTHPKIAYKSIWPTDHRLDSTSKQGGQQPLIDWGALTPAARNALNTTNFGAASPKFTDRTFGSTLAKTFM
ncbi:NPP1 family protein [Jiella sp. MQZ9-1]|uniref:NPP1 family protein n=1 Tax=Jiella flava TaxID=2816857 RepID=A0A939FW68_9HYPH|nr:NPP1 family protein [Jiella flava]MBO0661285.1 NPP1 family protein [Jiella flava]MCD2469930.1 NPP1 family protein [Jiella flava]